MTGDKVDKATMTYGNRDDMWVANKVRMLMRDDLDHEFVCVGARDRIMYLSQEVERLTALCDGYRGEVAGLHDIAAEHSAEVERLKGKLGDAVSALTRARAEGMEEAAKIAEEMPTPGYADDYKRDGYETATEQIAAAIRATKGDSDEG